jgi:hypothetical protein
MTRCCSDTLRHWGPKAPTEGLEVPCRWCDAYLRYERIGQSQTLGWCVHDRVGDFVKRESSESATEAGERQYARILGRERAK